jgi:hypothetical protein
LSHQTFEIGKELGFSAKLMLDIQNKKRRRRVWCFYASLVLSLVILGLLLLKINNYFVPVTPN